MRKRIFIGLITLALFTNSMSQQTNCFVINEFKTSNVTTKMLATLPLYFPYYMLLGSPKVWEKTAASIEPEVRLQSSQYKHFSDSLPTFKALFQKFDQINQATHTFMKTPSKQAYESNTLSISALLESFEKVKEIPTCADYFKSKYPENEILQEKRGFRNIKLGDNFEADGFDQHNKHDSNGEPLETEYGKNNSMGDLHDSLVGYPIYSITVRTYKDQVSFIGISIGGGNGEKVDASLITEAIEKNFGKASYRSLENDASGVFLSRRRFISEDYIMDLDNSSGSISLNYYWVTAYKNMEEETKNSIQDKRQAEIDSRKKLIDQSGNQF